MSLPDRYRPTGDLLGGGFSQVIVCMDTHLSRRVAVKRLRDPGDMPRLHDEINALLEIRSDHVVQVLDLIHLDEELMIVEEFVDGADLSGPGPHRERLESFILVLWQIASGLRDIHRHGIIHRDIKPWNIMCDSNGVVKILDFGLARSASENAHTVGFVGTRGFAAPELFSTGHVRFRESVDIYAFGATAFWLASGNLPSELQNFPPQAMVDPSRFFQGTALSVPENVAIMLSRCVSRNPEDRPTAGEVCDQLEEHILRWRHEALLISGSNVFRLNSENRKIRLLYGEVGSFDIEYDGVCFRFVAVDGEVSINNSSLVPGALVPGSCVIAIGEATRPSRQRAFVTFDVSQPEVAL